MRVLVRTAVPLPLRRFAERVRGSALGSRLAHGALWSVAGAGLLRASALAASIITSRVLGKQAYGEFGVLTSTVVTFQAFAGLGLGMTATKYVAELREKSRERAGRILALSFVMSAGTGLLATGLLWGFAPWLAARTLGAPHLAGLLRVASCGVLFATLSGAEAGALAGFEAFRTTARINLWSGLLSVPIAVLGVWFWGVAGAVWATVFAAVVQWALTHVALRRIVRQQGIAVPLSAWWREHRVLWTFSLPALAQGVMVAPVNWVAAAILVNQPNGYPEMGAFSAANHWFAAVLFLPSALCGPVLPVLSERVSCGDRPGTRKVLLAAVAMNAAAALPIVLLGSLASPWVMAMYGPGFADAWPTLVAALGAAAILAVTNPVGYLLAASGRLWLAFVTNAGWAAVFLGATKLLVGWGALGVAGGRLIAYAVHATWTVWFAWAIVRTRKAT